MRRGGTAHLFRAFPRRRTPPFRVGTSSDKDEEGEGRVCAVGGGGEARRVYIILTLYFLGTIYITTQKTNITLRRPACSVPRLTFFPSSFSNTKTATILLRHSLISHGEKKREYIEIGNKYTATRISIDRRSRRFSFPPPPLPPRAGESHRRGRFSFRRSSPSLPAR